ncbi:NAD(+)/NADH kinase [Nonomuraea angiospora]|uniref:ATP-NAD kinase family protein n=1 Tax=Nonomuraea angiospora TaxID=46172 RepID=UPI003405B311
MTGAAVVGLVVNPVAGLGGAAGLKGSDGVEVQCAALAMGATPRAGERAARAVRTLMARRPGTRVLTVPGRMGEDSVRAAGAPYDLVRPPSGHPAGTSAEDTRRAVAALAGVDLLLFAGGDGTARDVLDAVRALGGQAPPALGVPAGVKVYSGCFAVSPAVAGFVAAEFDPARTADAEVVDLDEDAYRRGLVSPRLYGSLRVPAARAALSGRKTGSSGVAPATAEGVAREVVARMRPGVRYVLGPGATTRAVGRTLGLATTLLGVDVVERAPEGGRLVAAKVVERAPEGGRLGAAEVVERASAGGRLVAADVAEAELFGLVSGTESVLVLSVIGGQGFVLGRGNQQVSPRVLDAVLHGGHSGRLLVLATQQKLASLKGRPLLADSGDEDLDKKLGGHVQVITGYRESTIYRICAASEEFDG